ncbi:2TM domain-containing protein [Pseudomonas shirazensis]
METNSHLDREKFDFRIARKKVIKLKSFCVHAFIYSIALVVYILKDYYAFPINYFPFKYLNYVTMFIWTCVFVISVIDMFAYNKIFGKEWEERKLKNILDKRKQQQKWE